MLEQAPTIGNSHLLMRKHLTERHSSMLEKLIALNTNKQKYWILGWVNSVRKNGKTKIIPKMLVLDKIPQLSAESYLYEVDNTAGTRTLLWVMHPNNKLSLPTLGKVIHVADESGVNLAAEVTGENITGVEE